MTRYKLTDKQDQTHGRCLWGEGVEHTAPGGKQCTAAVIHWYATALLAVLHDPIHGVFGPSAHLWECEVDETGTDGLKCWGTRCKTIKRIALPVVTQDQAVHYAILCALAAPSVCEEPPAAFHTWARNWLSGADRSLAAAQTAAQTAAEWAAAAAARAARSAASAWTAQTALWAARAALGEPLDLAAIAEQAIMAEQAEQEGKK